MKPIEANEPLFTIAEAAQRLSCSKMHIYRLINSGLLRSIDISMPGAKQARTRVRPDDLKNYVEAGTWDAKSQV